MSRLELQNSVVDKLTYGVYLTGSAGGSCFPSGLIVKNEIRNCTTGIFASGVSGMAGVSGNNYTTNGTDENGVDASFGYVGA